MTGADIVASALREIRVINAVDAPSSEDAQLGLDTLNRILDDFNAERRAVYAEAMSTFELTIGLNPHTIGPTGATWTVTQRPEDIRAANLIVDDVRYPLEPRDAAWWMARSSPEAATDMPTDFYYEKNWPNGRIWFAGVPGVEYDVELLLRVVLADLTAASTFTMPPGYRSALTLTLAEELTNPFSVELTPSLVVRAQKARARVFSSNTVIPRIATRDDGMPGRGSSYDFRTRSVS